MLKVLFIEDEPQAIESVEELITSEHADLSCKVSKFEVYRESIASFQPDIVILDLLDGGTSPEAQPEGLKIYDFIWRQRFCPIIVYSAQMDIFEHPPHPFVKRIQKGTGSDRKVLNDLNKLRPHVEALKEAEEVVRRSFSDAMRDFAPYASKVFADDTRRFGETIKRSGRRRVAALMDEPLPDETALAGWEQYLYPPVSPDIQLGDILRKIDESDDAPASFRVVLSPSCDLVRSRNRQPKVSHVLVAGCCSMKDGLSRTTLKNTEMKKLKERLGNAMLTRGYLEAIVPFPCLPEQIPTMAADLRALELIPVKDISKDISKPDGKFLRIASIDSPFRELIAWAYQQTACRPGLPDRDFAAWCKEISASLEKDESGEER